MDLSRSEYVGGIDTRKSKRVKFWIPMKRVFQIIANDRNFSFLAQFVLLNEEALILAD